MALGGEMNLETLQLALIVGSIILWSSGGMFWKPFRRYFLPFYLTIIGLFIHYSAYGIDLKVIWSGLALCIVTHLPYGEKTPYPIKFLVGCSYALSTLPLGFTIWQLVLPIVFIVTFWLSNTKKWQGEFPWRVCEALTGGLIGIIWAVKV
jgi:hypothetical protein